MFKLKNILFPVEFSERDQATAPFVLSMAQRYDARVVVFHALQSPPPFYAGMNVMYPQDYDFTGALDEIRIDLQKFTCEQLPKVDVECVAQPGEAASAIAQFACANGMDLIAMPTHGYGMFRRTLLGSVTAKVLHDARVPVWTSAHAPEPSHRAHPKPRRIVCALDMKLESLRTLEAAVEMATDAGAALELAHVPAATVPPDVAAGFLEELLAKTTQSEHVNVAEVAHIAESGGTGANIAETLRKLALQTRADLLVIGRGAIKKGFGRLYANSYEIIRESPCPVLSV
ncbi:MAG TPA: universal stress protein [Bryobacteraceae bacterium]|jgi:nucleotide-binding universal stress UspA family protein|nr:universal stress protein [Bryobacteraceae bacterium]